MDTQTKIFVADSNIFYIGIPFQSTLDTSYLISTLIYDEIKHIKKNISGLETLITAKRVSLVDPSAKMVNNLKQLISSIEASKLSNADLSVIALGKELQYPIISSDYTLANLAKKLHLKVIIPGKGVFKEKLLKHYCSLCKSFTETSEIYCDSCGNKLVFKKVK